MIFTPATEGYAKRMARALRERLEQNGFEANHSECLETISRMFGHAGWLAMQKAIRRGDRATVFDHEISADDLSARRVRQVSAICDLGVEISVARSIAADLEASSQSGPRKSSYLERIRFLVDAGGMEDAEPIAYEALYHGEGEVYDLVLELSASDARWRHVAAIALLLGHGVGRDARRAEEMLQGLLMADIADRRKGFVASTLADISAGKHGLPRDSGKEIRYYRLAALTYDHPLAAFNLGLHYQNASPPDLEAAANMFALALRGGSIEAATNLGLLLIRNGIHRDGVDPFAILQVASRFGDGVATTALQQLVGTDIEAAYRAGKPFSPIPRAEPGLSRKVVAIWSVVMGLHGWRTSVDDDLLVVALPGRKAMRIPILITEGGRLPSGFDLFLLSRPVMERAGSKGHVLRIGFRLIGTERVPAYLTRGDDGSADFGRRDAITLTFMDAEMLTSKFDSTALEIGERA